MDTLLATYASSDEEEEEEWKPSKPLSNSIPPPKPSSLLPPKTTTSTSSSSLFNYLPPPKTSSSSIFSSLPPPKTTTTTPSQPPPKKVVQFRPPIDPSIFKSHDLDEEDEAEKEEKERRAAKFSATAASKPLSSIIPPPRNTLGLAPTVSSRRSVVLEEANDVPAATSSEIGGSDAGGENRGFEGYGGDDAASGWDPSYESYGNYESYGGQWDYGSTGTTGGLEVVDLGRIAGKRGRNEIPTEIVEVKQEELIKNRPREDQVKLTGIAFGPAYQPVSSSKGKPTKLHKRKHQIGSLYFEMKQKETELAERRSRGFLTKKETQAKYGW